MNEMTRTLRGGLPTSSPSSEQETEDLAVPLESGRLCLRIIRNTNITCVHEQKKEDCYAYAACSAYINTLMRMFGLEKEKKPLPKFDECLPIADYNHGRGGKPSESIRRLEEHFKYGVKFSETKKLSIKDAIMKSVIVSFETNDNADQKIINGSLMEKVNGPNVGWHAVLVEGYDLEKDCLICKNSWKDLCGGRFDFRTTATNDFMFTVVDFDIDKYTFKPNLKVFKDKIKDCTVTCAWMDHNTAFYSNNFLCEYHPEKDDNLNYKGYYADNYIGLYLNRSDELKLKERLRFSRHFGFNHFKNYPHPIRTNQMFRFRYLYLMEFINGPLCPYTVK